MSTRMENMKEVMYIEPQDAKCQCLTCKNMVPSQHYNKYQYSHLLTADGKHFIVRIGWCPYKYGSFSFKKDNGCNHYIFDSNKEIIIYKGR